MSAKNKNSGPVRLSKSVQRANKSFFKHIRRFIIASIVGGIVLVLPLTLVYAATRFLWVQAQRITAPIKQLIDLNSDLAAWVVDLTALGIMLTILFILGIFVQTNMGKEFWNYFDQQILSKIPLYTVLRDTVQQFLGNTDKMPFSEVVEVDVFNSGTKMIGFVSDKFSDGRYSIFVPTGPNPTNGFIFLVEESQLVFSNIRPEEAMRVVVGVGTGASHLFSQSLIAKKQNSTSTPVIDPQKQPSPLKTTQ